MPEENIRSNSIRLLLSSTLFAVGLFSLTFSFPLLATTYHYSYSFIGFLGVVLAIPFIVIAGIYTRLDYKYLRPGTIFSYAGSMIVSIVLIFRNEQIFVTIFIISSVIQAFWWITTEISLSLFKGRGNAEKYSAGWGVPNAIVPIVAGYIVQFFGFDVVFVVAAISFGTGLIFIPRYEYRPVGAKYSNIKLRYVLSLLFAGISMGFIFFVIVPVLKYYAIPASVIGIIVGIFGGSSAVGYILLNFIRDRNVKFYAILSSILVFPTFLFGIYHSVYLAAVLMVPMGLGTSVAMSKILSYVSGASSARLGVFYYESVFGVGAILGSFGGGILFQFFGGLSILLLFMTPIVYIVSLLIIDRKPYASENSSLP